MYLGIDLGTSNSAIAGLRDGRATVFKTPEGTDVMPSVIYRDRRGTQVVGVRAYDQFMLAPGNVVHGFKRLMGTATPQRFESAGTSLTPEEASAEVLKAIVGYAALEAGAGAVTGAVITIPAAFNQMQSEATLAAAHAAGLDRVALLQEPVAAAMAAMAGAANRSGLFLVYDLGGGTFDVALVQALEGSVTVLSHEGINMLGGRDFDRLIVDNVVRPWLARTFDLPDNLHGDKRFERLLRVTRRAAENAKIELSSREATTITAPDEIVRLEDRSGEPIYLDVPLDRATLDALVDEKVSDSIRLCRKILEDNGYSHEDIDRVVLIGGPTKMPTIRSRVQGELGIAVEDVGRIDPMTAVAIGAAIYCESRDWSQAVSTAKPAQMSLTTSGAISVAYTYTYEARTPAPRARLTVTATGHCAGATVQVDSTLGWSSGRRSIEAPVTLDLDLPDLGPNRFSAVVFDASGRPVAPASRDIVIERTIAATSGIPASQTIAVKLRDESDEGNTLAVLVPKGSLLPQSGVARYRAAEPLRAGDPGALRIELFQMDDEGARDPELNLAIGEFRIEGTDLPQGRSLRRGDAIVVHWGMSDSQHFTAEVEIPSLEQRFDARNFYDYQAGLNSFEGEDGSAFLNDSLDRAQAELDRAAEAMPSATSALLQPIRRRLEAQRAMAADTIDPETRRSTAEETRMIRQAVAAACREPRVRQQILRQQLAAAKRCYDEEVRAGATSSENERADLLARNGRVAIDAGDGASFDVAERQVRAIYALWWAVGQKQFPCCANLWSQVRGERHLARDRALFDRTIAAGNFAMAEGDIDSLREAIYAAFRNLPAFGVQEHVRERASLMRQ